MKTKNKAAVALGSIKSLRKAEASRTNGKLGGRPRVSESLDFFGIPEETHHSLVFLRILKEDDASRDKAIRAITHANPLLVFWVSPDGKIDDAGNAHHKNPPNNDRSVLSSPTHKGYLRGRAAFLGNVIYVVIYGDNGYELSNKQFALIRRSYPRILSAIQNKNPKLNNRDIQSAQFINEIGDDIMI